MKDSQMTDSLKSRVMKAAAFDEKHFSFSATDNFRKTAADQANARLLPLIEKLAECVEALETLKVAVNDKVSDPGATAFIAKHLAALEAEMGAK